MEHARNFVLQLGSLIALYVSLTALVALLFGVINVLIPDSLDQIYYSYENTSAGIRFSIAFLVVFFPVYIVLTRLSHTLLRRDGERARTPFVKWLIYLSLLVGGFVLLGDLVAVILSFLNGELTLRFFSKVAVLFVVVGAAFTYYTFEVRGYWETHEKKSKLCGAIASAIVLAAIVLGFFFIEPPAQQRASIYDRERVSDLMQIQSQIGEYYRVKQSLPTSLEELEIIGFGYESPVDPESGESYVYERVSDTSFSLCADFSSDTETASERFELSFAKPYGFEGTWEHTKGETCFTRTIDPDFFRPIR